MNIIEKEKQQKMIVQNLKGIEFVTIEAVKTKDNFRKTINDLNMNGIKTFSPQHVEMEMQKEKESFAAKMLKVNEDVVKRLEELRALIRDRDSVLDLNNTALTNALVLIQTIGSTLSFEEAQKINANFIHDQSSLNAIRAAYKSHGVVSQGNIDELIYDANNKINNLKDLAFQGFVQDGSINFFANELSKLAKLKGTTTESLPDAYGANEAMRRIAGLPV